MKKNWQALTFLSPNHSTKYKYLFNAISNRKYE